MLFLFNLKPNTMTNTQTPQNNTEDLSQFIDWYTHKIGGIHYITGDTFARLQDRFDFFKS